jgi:peptidoglycan L-alanyl-D-glutamate endopeptidase CwlK
MNPFQAEIDAVLATAKLKNDQIRNLPSGQRAAAATEALRLFDRADELIALGLEWAEKRLASVVLELEAMARAEAAQQSDIVGNLQRLAAQVRGELGAAAPTVVAEAVPVQRAETAPVALSPAPPQPSPVPPAAAPLAAPEAIAPAAAVDPEARDTDLMKIHPAMRERVERLMEALQQREVPMRLFEAYRAPERQAHLFAKGRDAAGNVIGKVVTHARPWQSYHQYGLAVDCVIAKAGVDPWETATEDAKAWWRTYHEVAQQLGLERLSFELPHVQLAELKTSGLLAGEYPPGGDATWSANLAKVVARWTGSDKPPAPVGIERPPLTVVALPDDAGTTPLDLLGALPPIAPADWANPCGGQRWRVDGHGVYLKSMHDGLQPIRSPGTPKTCGAIVERLGRVIAQVCEKHGVPPELVIMTIATEAGDFVDEGFTGPKTFRWEPGPRDYSAGPMQILSATAREISAAANLGYSEADFPALDKEPKRPPEDLALYRPEVALDIGAALIRRIMRTQGTNPVLVAAAYNAGSVRASSANLWCIHCFGNHLDRAAMWFGDACALLGTARI